MEKEKKIAFRGAVGGYKKEDVNLYIAGMAQDFSRRSDEWDAEKEKLLRLLDEEKAEKDMLAKQRDELACQVYAAETETAAQKQAAEEAEKISLELKATIGGLSARIHEYETELTARKEAQSEDAENELLFQKLNDKVEQIMTAAADSAREIVSGALLRGDEVIAEAEKKAEVILSEASAHSGTSYYDDVMKFAAEIRDSMNKLMQEISAKKAEMSGKLADIRPAPKPERPAQPEKGAASTLDEKIERFLKSTLDAIVGMTKKNKNG